MVSDDFLQKIIDFRYKDEVDPKTGTDLGTLVRVSVRVKDRVMARPET